MGDVTAEARSALEGRGRALKAPRGRSARGRGAARRGAAGGGRGTLPAPQPLFQ